jgi:ATP-binding protein involved in chromosome partitioning
MKIAIPLYEGRLCAHFGHCEQFALVQTDGADKVRTVELAVPPAHAPGVLPAWLSERGAGVVIAGGMGRRAQGLFEAAGIRVVTGAPALPPEKLAEQYLAGTLVTGENVCDH